MECVPLSTSKEHLSSLSFSPAPPYHLLNLKVTTLFFFIIFIFIISDLIDFTFHSNIFFMYACILSFGE